MSVRRPVEKMSEAEVSLRLASYLILRGLADGVVEVAIDGAQVQTLGQIHFDLPRFFSASNWERAAVSDEWQGFYRIPPSGKVRIHSTPGKGDVVARLRTGQILRVECKKGPLSKSKSSQEYPLIREALGQLLTTNEVRADDILAVAVPHGDRFIELAARWRQAPLIKRFKIRIVTVAPDGNVFGLD